MTQTEPSYGFMTINKETNNIINEIYQWKDNVLYTASMMKIVFLGLFLEYGYDDLHTRVAINNNHKEVWGILDSLVYEDETSYNTLLLLMIVISDNTATNIIYEYLIRKIWDISQTILQKFGFTNTKAFDLTDPITFDYGSGQSTPYEFIRIMKYFFYDSVHADYIREILSKQYVKGRWLRYLDRKDFISTWNKTGQIDTVINDCGFLETQESYILYVVFYPIDHVPEFLYDVENDIYKKIWHIVKEYVSKTI